MKSAAAIALCALLLVTATPAEAATKVIGSHGESLSVSTQKVSPGSTLVVTGRNFDETVGIYLGFCLLPKKGEIPTPCGGGINKAGTGEASYWISSNSPPYGRGLAEPYIPGGRFKKSVVISKMIGKVNCAKVACAIAVRADHLNSKDRSYDLFIPITFKK